MNRILNFSRPCPLIRSLIHTAFVFAALWMIPLSLVAQQGNGLHFNEAAPSYIVVPYSSSLGNFTEQTVEFWVNPNFVNWKSFVSTTTESWAIGANGDNQIFYRRNSSNNFSTGTMTAGQWQHVAVVISNTTHTINFYLNGVNIGTISGVGNISNLTAGQNMGIGGESVGPGGSFPNGGNAPGGIMDELRIWNTARTSAQITANMNKVIDPTTAGLVAYYRFDQGVAAGTNTGLTTLTDLTSNNNNGTLYKFALTGSTSNWVTGRALSGYPPSNDANLTALTTTAGTLIPSFSAATTTYTATVNNTTPMITVTPIKSNANATIQVRVNGGAYETVVSGAASSGLPLNVGSNTVEMKVTAEDGTTIKTYTLTVCRTAIPAVSIAITSGSQTICSGTSVTFTATPTDGGSAPTYQWLKGGLPISGETAATYTSTILANSDAISVVLTTSPACAPAPTATSSAIVMTVNTTPTVSLSNTAATNCLYTAALSVSTASTLSQLKWYNGASLVNTAPTAPGTTGTTVAGGNGSGSADNQLFNPSGVSVDAAGNIYVCDLYNHRIQKWVPGATTGITVAGGNGSGSADNQLNLPVGFYVDASGNIYIADGSNQRIQKWAVGASTGTTVAGGNGYGSANNQLGAPQGVYVDAAGNIYVAEAGNNRISKWAVGATTGTTVAGGNGAGANANQLNYPTGIHLDAAGNMYIADYVNYRIQKWAVGASTGTTVAGGNGYGSADNQFTPNSFYIDATSNIYVCDQDNNRIQKWASGATTGTTVAGGNAYGANANQLGSPRGISVDATGNIYISDRINHRIQKWAVSVLTTYSPTTAGSYSAVVTNAAGGCTATTATYVVNPLLIPSVAIAVTGGSAITCAGASVTFTATPTNGGNAPTYQWLKDGSPISGETSATYTSTTLANNEAISVVLTSNVACLSTTTATSAAIVMTVNPVLTPSVAIAITTGSATICNGTSVTFTATPTNGGNAPTYQWLKDGLPISGETGATYTSTTLANNEAISVVLISNVACPTSATATSAAIVMTVNPILTPSVAIAVTTGSATICNGTSVTLTATPTNGGNAPTYQWLKDGLPISGETSATYTSTTLANNEAISVVLTSNVACPTSATATSAATVMTVNPILIPSVAIAVTTGSATICNGTSVTLTATPTNGGNAPTYQWLKDGLPISGETGATYTSTTLANNEAISVVLTSNEACLSTATATSAAIVMTVNPILTPSVNIAITTGSATICNGTSVTFTATPTNGGNAPTYQWLKDGLPISGETGATYTSTTLANNEAISVVLTSNVACPTSATATSAAIVMTVNPILTPSVAIAVTTGSATICNGTSVTLTATPTNGGNAPTYQWLKDGLPISGETSATYTSTTLANNEAISVVLTSNVACPTSATATSAATVMTVNPILTPSVAIAVTTGSATICNGTSVTLTATPTNGGNAPTYQWLKDGLPISGETSATYTSTTLANNEAISVVLTSNSTAPCLSTTTATSAAIVMTVNPILTPSVAIAVTTGSATICNGTSVTLTATPTNGGNAPTYQWLKGGLPISGETSATYTSTTLANNEAISVVLTSNVACPTSATATSAATVMTVNPILTPSVSIAITTGSATICNGTSVTFTATPTNGGNAPTYQWLKDGLPISGETSVTYTSTTLANNEAISVVLTSNEACLSTATATSAAIVMTVNPILTPSVAIAVTTGSAITCVGSSVTFTATPTNGGSTPTYQWLKDNVAISGATSATYTSTTLANNDIITCALTSNACTTTPIVTSTGITMSVGLPIVTSITGNPSVNVEATTTLACATSGGVWSSSNTAIATVDATTGVVTGVAGGTVTINYSVTNSCGTTTVTKSIDIRPATYCLTYKPVREGNYVYLHIGLLASTTTFRLGDGNTQFKYKSSVLSNPIISSTVLASNGNYFGIDLSNPSVPALGVGDSLVSFNFVFLGNTGDGLPISTTGTGTEIGVIRFNLDDATTSPNLRPYQDADAGMVIYNDNTTTPALLAQTTDCGNYDFPLNTSIAYATPAFCPSLTTASVTLTGTSGGTYSSSPAGLTLNTTTGEITPSTSAVGTYSVLYNIPASNGAQALTTVTINALPSITTQPIALTTACVGTTAHLSVVATGAGLTYQWQKGGVNITNATSATYNMPTLTTDDAGTYSVFISGTCLPTVSSADAVLVINTLPTAITGTPSVYATFTTTLANTLAGGTWSSSNTAVATINASTGLVTGITPGTVTISYSVTNACGTNAVTQTFTVIRNTVQVSIKAFLQGAYNASTSKMGDGLRSNSLVSSVEPYTGMAKFTHVGYGGGEVVDNANVLTVTGDNAIVDWVFVELRDKTTPSIILQTRAALIQRDGDIVDMDGVSPLTFLDVIADNYHIAVRHRNHLGFRSLTATALSSTTTALNFTNGSKTTFGINALKLVGGVYVMYSGNGDANAAVNAVDKNSVWWIQNGQFGYLRGDYDMNGTVNAVDMNAQWLGNNSRVQQLD